MQLADFKSSNVIDEQQERSDRPFILVRDDRDLGMTFFFSSYLESVETVLIHFKGKTFTGIKLHEPTARKTALWQGWTCITESYYSEELKEVSEPLEDASDEPIVNIDVKPTKAKRKAPRKRVKK